MGVTNEKKKTSSSKRILVNQSDNFVLYITHTNPSIKRFSRCRALVRPRQPMRFLLVRTSMGSVQRESNLMFSFSNSTASTQFNLSHSTDPHSLTRRNSWGDEPAAEDFAHKDFLYANVLGSK